MKSYLDDPFKHYGGTFAKIDCPIVKPKKVFILKGNTHGEIVKYFKTRCDFKMLP